MPSCTRTPEQSPFDHIRPIARRADSLAVMLAALEFMPADAAMATLQTCISLANEVAESLTSASIGGAA